LLQILKFAVQSILIASFPIDILGQNLTSYVNSFVSEKCFSKANISVLAYDLTSGDTLLQYHPNKTMASASTTKLFSTSMALELLGPDYRFKTMIYHDGEIRGGKLYGNLWIKGGGDVSLGSKHFNLENKESICLNKWIDTLIELGIHSIEGKLFVDASSFGYEGPPIGWSPADITKDYGACAAGLNYYDNQIKYYFSTSEIGNQAKYLGSYPPQNYLKIRNNAVTANVKEENTSVKGYLYDPVRIISGKLPANTNRISILGSVADPEHHFMDVFFALCKEKGIIISKGAATFRKAKIKSPDYDTMKLLFIHDGSTVGEIARLTNVNSNNFFAEGLLNGVAFHYAGYGGNSQGRNLYANFWGSRIDTTNLKLYDGSGLSRSNRISASHLCSLLNYVYTSKFYGVFFNTLPVAGKSGTLKSLCKDQIGEGRIHAKSGTMTGIKSYAGYVHSKSGRKIVFAFIVNGHDSNPEYVKTKMQILLNVLAGL